MGYYIQSLSLSKTNSPIPFPVDRDDIQCPFNWEKRDWKQDLDTCMQALLIQYCILLECLTLLLQIILH